MTEQLKKLETLQLQRRDEFVNLIASVSEQEMQAVKILRKSKLFTKVGLCTLCFEKMSNQEMNRDLRHYLSQVDKMKNFLK